MSNGTRRLRIVIPVKTGIQEIKKTTGFLLSQE
jgi:hypothetical protein